MKCLLIIFLFGGVSKGEVKERINLQGKGASQKVKLGTPQKSPFDIGLFQPGGLYPVQNFEFKPYRLHPSREFLKVGKNVKTGTLTSVIRRNLMLNREYGDIYYDFKEGKAKIPEPAFYSYSEISFWKEVYPELQSTRERIGELVKSSKPKNKEEIHRMITQLKEQFHQKFLEKRIEVMKEVQNKELEIEAQKAYQKFIKYKARREKARREK